MSVLINEKLHSHRLKWRWPLSRQVTLSIGTLAVLLTVWWAVAALQLISPLFLPPPQQVLAKLLTIAGPQGFMDATLWQHLAASLTRIVLALLAAVLIGIPVGIAMGLSPTVRGILDPIIELYRPVPPLAYLPLMVIWFGIGENSKILLIYLAILLTVWWVVAALQLISPLFLPPPQQVLAKLLTIAGPQGFMDATLWQHLAASLTRIVLALLAAVVIGIPVGIAMGLSPTVRGILDPIIELYRPVPPLAYLPLMVIWFGIGETSKILLIYLAIFAPVAMSALAGVKSAQQVRIRAAQSLGASRAQVLWFVILPGALPEILTGLRIGLGVGWSTLVAAELIAATRGLGFMVQSAGEFLATDVVLAGIAVIAIIAFLLELGLRALQRRLTPWHGEVQ